MTGAPLGFTGTGTGAAGSAAGGRGRGGTRRPVAFARNTQVLKDQCDGLTNDDSLLPLPFRGNCMNWVLGHILENRSFILELVHEQPIWAEGDEEPYNQGTKGLDPAKARPWESLIADLEATQERLVRGLEKLDPEELDARHAENAKRPRGAQLHFMAFHEGYHAGQLGILRRVAGKPGAI
jgi:uncharacterized damage-inducible protein DinB